MAVNRAIVFDLDDTLYLEREFVFSGFDAVAEYVADRQDPDHDAVFSFLWGSFEDGIRGNNFDRLVEHFGLPIPIADLVEIYRTHEPTLSLLPDARACLETLANVRLAIVTDGTSRKQQNKISALDLSEYMDHVFISGDIDGESEKPSSSMFELFLEASGVDPASATHVGDNATKDFVAPKKLGMESIWIRRAFGEYVHLEPSDPAAEPDLTLTNLCQLPPLIEGVQT